MSSISLSLLWMKALILFLGEYHITYSSITMIIYSFNFYWNLELLKHCINLLNVYVDKSLIVQIIRNIEYADMDNLIGEVGEVVDCFRPIIFKNRMKTRSQTSSSKLMKQSKHIKESKTTKALPQSLSQHSKSRMHNGGNKKGSSSSKSSHSMAFRAKQGIKKDVVEDYLLINDNFYMANTNTERQEIKDFHTKYRSEMGAKKLCKKRVHAHEHPSNIYRNNVIVKNNNIYIQSHSQEAKQEQRKISASNIESYVQNLSLSERLSIMMKLQQDFRANSPDFYAASQHNRNSESDCDKESGPQKQEDYISQKYEQYHCNGQNDRYEDGDDLNIEDKLFNLSKDFKRRLKNRKDKSASLDSVRGADQVSDDALGFRNKPDQALCSTSLYPGKSENNLGKLQRKLQQMREEIIAENQSKINEVLQKREKNEIPEEVKRQMICECHKGTNRQLNAISFAEELYESVMNTESHSEDSTAETNAHLQGSKTRVSQQQNKQTNGCSFVPQNTRQLISLASLANAYKSKGVLPHDQKCRQLIHQLGEQSEREEEPVIFFTKPPISWKRDSDAQDESSQLIYNGEQSNKKSIEFDDIQEIPHRRRFDDVILTADQVNCVQNGQLEAVRLKQPSNQERVEQVLSQQSNNQKLVNSESDDGADNMDQNQLLLSQQLSVPNEKDASETNQIDKICQTQSKKIMEFKKSTKMSHQMQSLLVCSQQSSLKSKIKIPLLLTKEKVEELQLEKKQKNIGRMRTEIQRKVSFQMSEFEYDEDEHHFTTLADINGYIVGLYEYIMKIDMEKMVERLNLPYGKPVREKIYTMQHERELGDYDEALQYYPVLDESYYHSFNKQISFTVRRVREEEKIHNRAVFDCFSFHLNAYRPYYDLEGEVYPWSVSEKGITFYEISEENIEQVFEKTKIKVLEYCSSLCGLLPRDVQLIDSPEIIDERNKEYATKEEKQTLIEQFEKWGIKLINEDTMVRLKVSQQIMLSIIKECVIEIQQISNLSDGAEPRQHI